ncbi:IS110 family transposase [Tersicoccus solisilvae]|uniref:IS110 family transposase n=1 Tax=Tersicoccus solisilvae TaxID=1882339 RepID=A0ABQ1PR38_9MICC|nr:IS110 family transposase [Tersicoccus solisilvae]GGD01126.1 IS110 family transposase [Tersicoccus solisilvae]
METLVERCAGLDVHKDTVVACVRVTTGGDVVEKLHTFGTTTSELLALADWLAQWKVTLVAMEATGVYWKPVYYVLEDRFGCWLLNARHMHNVPGRKTDAADAAWIAELTAHGLVTASFVPPEPIRQLRNLTRYRKAQIDERGREAQRLDKVLQDAGIKLSSVASDILGVSGRAMLRGLVEGTRDPEVLSELARTSLRKKIPALREALTGRFSDHHALIVGEILAKLDYLDEAIGRLSEEIDRVITPFAHQRDLLTTAVGVDRRTAEGLIAEIGVNMSVFGSAGRLASWAGRCPGQYESAGKSRSGRTRKGNKWLTTYLHDAAMAASRSKNTYANAQFHRIASRRGYAKAIGALEHSLLVAVYYMIDRDQPYRELGADYFTRRRPGQRAQHLVHELTALGYLVTTPATT